MYHQKLFHLLKLQNNYSKKKNQIQKEKAQILLEKISLLLKDFLEEMKFGPKILEYDQNIVVKLISVIQINDQLN